MNRIIGSETCSTTTFSTANQPMRLLRGQGTFSSCHRPHGTPVKSEAVSIANLSQRCQKVDDDDSCLMADWASPIQIAADSWRSRTTHTPACHVNVPLEVFARS